MRDVEVALKPLGEVFGGVEMGGGEDLADPSVEALHHPIGLGVARWDQSVLDVVFSTRLIEVVLTAGLVVAFEKAIGELRTVVAQEFDDGKGGLGGQSIEESGGAGGGFFGVELQVHPAGGPIDGDEEVPAMAFSRQLGEVCDIDVDKAWLGSAPDMDIY